MLREHELILFQKFQGTFFELMLKLACSLFRRMKVVLSPFSAGKHYNM
jgi:hypothetical protein